MIAKQEPKIPKPNIKPHGQKSIATITTNDLAVSLAKYLQDKHTYLTWDKPTVAAVIADAINNFENKENVRIEIQETK